MYITRASNVPVLISQDLSQRTVVNILETRRRGESVRAVLHDGVDIKAAGFVVVTPSIWSSAKQVILRERDASEIESLGKRLILAESPDGFVARVAGVHGFDQGMVVASDLVALVDHVVVACTSC